MPVISTLTAGDKPNSSFKKICTLFLAGILAVAVFGYGVFSFMLDPVDAKNPQTKTISIRAGATTREIGSVLTDAGLIKSRLAFDLYSRYEGTAGKLKAGDYSLNTGMSLPEIIRRIYGGEVDNLTFTVPEGFTVKQIADTLADKGLVNRERFMELVARGDFKYDFLQGVPPGEKKLEGYLFPDTYQITRGTTEEDIINLMLTRFDRVIPPDFREKAARLGLNEHQAVTLASMIEREAREDEERPKVASVFLNRLNKGWKLDSDATVQYALGTNKTRLFFKDLEIDSPYNTYKYKGLPPGPIASPGRPSLEAAVNPANTEYMFFVVSEKGQHVFSRTLAEHERNRTKYLSRFKTPSRGK